MLKDRFTQITEKHALCGSTRVTLTLLERHLTVKFSTFNFLKLLASQTEFRLPLLF